MMPVPPSSTSQDTPSGSVPERNLAGQGRSTTVVQKETGQATPPRHLAAVGEVPAAYRKPVLPPDPPFAVPDGQQIPIEHRDVPSHTFLDGLRRFDISEAEQVIPNMIWTGVNVISGRPGCGKTVLAVQVAMCAGMLIPFAGYAPDERGRCLYLDMENGAAQIQRTSLRVAPYGTAGLDGSALARWVELDSDIPGACFGERFADLEQRLIRARDVGYPFRLVVIDSLIGFFGPYPPNTARDQHEGYCMRLLNALGVRFRCGIILIHHTNKAGLIAGSTQIEGGLTTAYVITREPGEDAATIGCLKNRVAPEKAWEGSFTSGVWEMSEEISREQSLSTGTQRRILDWLAVNSPAMLDKIRVGLADVKPGTLKVLLSRLHQKKFVTHHPDGRWSCLRPEKDAPPPAAPVVTTGPAPSRKADPADVWKWESGSVGEAVSPHRNAECAGCHAPMAVIRDGQTCHPDPECEQKAREEARQVEVIDVVQPELAEPEPEAVVEVEVEEAGHPEPCQVCGVVPTGADTHPDCTPVPENAPKWPAFAIMRKTLEGSRMHPLWFIPAEDRDSGPWPAAVLADRSAEAGFRWTLPGISDRSEGIVVPFDRGQSFPAACSSVPVAANKLTRHGALDANPRDLGDADSAGKPTGLAGIVKVIAPEGITGMPHPLGRRAAPGEEMWIPSGWLEMLWKLHTEGVLPSPVVTDSWMGRRTVGLFDPYAAAVRDARHEHASNPDMTIAVKRSASIALRCLYPTDAKSPWWRPDWRAAIVAEAATRIWMVAWRAVQAGAVLASASNVDQVAYLVDAPSYIRGDGNGGTWAPPGYKIGRDPGTYHWGDTRVRAGTDLTGVDMSRVRPGPDPKVQVITGPLPLGVWVNRRG